MNSNYRGAALANLEYLITLCNVDKNYERFKAGLEEFRAEIKNSKGEKYVQSEPSLH